MSKSCWLLMWAASLSFIGALTPNNWLQQLPFGDPWMYRVAVLVVAVFVLIFAVRASHSDTAAG